MNERQYNVEQYEQNASSAPHWYMDSAQLLDVIEYYEENGRHQDADACLKHALALHPSDEQLLIKKAYFLKSAGNLAEATAIIDHISNQQDLEVRFFRIEQALSDFSVEKARALFAQILVDDNPSSPDWSLREEMAEIYLDYGYIRPALEVIAPVPPSYKDYSRILILRSEIYFQLREMARAQEALNAAIDLNPFDASLWGMLADVQYEAQMLPEAIESCLYALAVDPSNEKALRVKFFAHIGSKQYVDAAETAFKYEHLYPNQYYVPMHLGEALYAEGHYDEALPQFCIANRVCANESPDKLRLVGDVAGAQMHLGQCADSFQTLQCACSLGVTFPDVCIQCATLAVECEAYEFAAQTLRKVAEMPLSYEQKTQVVQLFSDFHLYSCCPEIFAKFSNHAK